MKRRTFVSTLFAASFAIALPGSRLLAREVRDFHSVSVSDDELARLERDADWWRRHLGDDAWDILFRDNTERPYSSPLDDHWEEGTYVCAACFLPLFSSDTKYDSKTGWPSFWKAYEAHMGTKRDFKMIWPRTEYHCARCGGHQGHVFDDGPEPTGKRWCNNGLALEFIAKGEPLPDLRG